MGYRQVVRHGILIPAFVGSNPTSPAPYQHLQIAIKADTDSGKSSAYKFVPPKCYLYGDKAWCGDRAYNLVCCDRIIFGSDCTQ